MGAEIFPLIGSHRPPLRSTSGRAVPLHPFPSAQLTGCGSCLLQRAFHPDHAVPIEAMAIANSVKKSFDGHVYWGIILFVHVRAGHQRPSVGEGYDHDHGRARYAVRESERDLIDLVDFIVHNLGIIVFDRVTVHYFLLPTEVKTPRRPTASDSFSATFPTDYV